MYRYGEGFYCNYFITVYNPTTNEVFPVYLDDFDCQTMKPLVGLTVKSRLCALSRNNTLIAFKYVLGSKVYICYILLLKCHYLLFLTLHLFSTLLYAVYSVHCYMQKTGKIQTEQQFLKRVCYCILLL